MTSIKNKMIMTDTGVVLEISSDDAKMETRALVRRTAYGVGRDGFPYFKHVRTFWDGFERRRYWIWSFSNHDE